MAKQLARELINAGVHFGHGVSRWNPKMAPFIFDKRGNIHIIDVKKTLKGILIAKKLLADIVSSGNDVVFVGTKRQAQKAVIKAAESCGMHYISQLAARQGSGHSGSVLSNESHNEVQESPGTCPTSIQRVSTPRGHRLYC